MSDTPTVWHYGLMAEYWAHFKKDAPELPFLLELVRRFGQPVLDLACGSGRILVKLLESGIDADGIDVSSDMIGHARAAAAARGFLPTLLVQAMHELDAPRRYKVIVICGSVGLGGIRQNDAAMLRRCHESLEPGGALVFDAQMEYASAASWNVWSNEGRERLPEGWPDVPILRMAPDGHEFRLRIRTIATNPFDQSFTREMTIEKWLGGERVGVETSLLRGNMYLPQELLSMLRCAGFRDVSTHGGYSGHEATDRDADIVFVAVK